jgi:ATP-dependent helicase HrpA
MLREKVTWYFKALPKAFRNRLIPLQEVVTAFLVDTPQAAEALPDAIRGWVRQRLGEAPPPDAWDAQSLPPHLVVNLRVVDASGRELALDRDVGKLRQRLGEAAQMTFAASGPAFERKGLRRWDFGDLPATLAIVRKGQRLTGYPALVDEGDSVAVKVFETEAEQRTAMIAGTRKLLLLTLPPAARYLQGRLDNQAKLELTRGNPYRSIAELLDDCAGAAVDRLVADAGGPVWSSIEFASLRDTVRQDLVDAVANVVTQVRQVLSTAYDIEQRLKSQRNPTLLPALADIRQQLKGLVHAGFVTETGWRQLHHLPRYLRGMVYRLDRLGGNLARDRQLTAQIHEIESEYRELRGLGAPEEGLREIRWMIEELRINFFAQSLGTAYPISDKRIFKAMDQLPV